MRFGITPLYTTRADIDAAVNHLAEVIATRAYDDPAFRARRAVT
jgi:kynureninase